MTQVVLTKMAKAMRRTRLAAKATTAQEAAEAMGIEIPDNMQLDLPERLKEEADAFFNELYEQPYWDDIDATTRDDIFFVLRDAIDRGVSIRDVAAVIVANNDYAEYRARNIARTELGGAMNAGHEAGIRTLEEESGVGLTKEWLSVMGPTTREDHADADGQEVAADLNFTVGGEETPYPSWHGLSARQRCNCQCTVISGLLGEELERDDEEDIAEDDGDVDPDTGGDPAPDTDERWRGELADEDAEDERRRGVLEEGLPPPNADESDLADRIRLAMEQAAEDTASLQEAIDQQTADAIEQARQQMAAARAADEPLPDKPTEVKPELPKELVDMSAPPLFLTDYRAIPSTVRGIRKVAAEEMEHERTVLRKRTVDERLKGATELTQSHKAVVAKAGRWASVEATLQAKENEINALVSRAAGNATPEDEKQYVLLKKERDAAKAEALAIKQEAWKAIAPKDRIKDIAAEGDAASMATVKSAKEFYKTVLSQRHAESGVHGDIEGNYQVEFTQTKSTREFYSSDGKVHINYLTGVETVVHEVGHSLEQSAQVHELAKGFLAKRVEGQRFEPMSKFSDAFPKKTKELAADGGFAKAWEGVVPAATQNLYGGYTGKFYGNNTEILSMGVELMYRDPIRFAQNDPEYFQFVAGVLNGSLLH